MKRERKIDIWFVLILFFVILVIPYALLALNDGTRARTFLVSMVVLAPIPCGIIAVIHTALTRRISGWFIGGEGVLLFLNGMIFGWWAIGDVSISARLGAGAFCGFAMSLVVLSTFLLQAVTMPIIGFFERRQAKKKGELP